MVWSEVMTRAGGGSEPAAEALTMETAPSELPAPLALLARLRDGEFDAIEGLLAPDVWLRNLLVRRVHESNTAAEAVTALRTWVGGPHGSTMLDADHHRMAGREFIRYRFLVRPTWAPDQPHVIEQAGYCRVKDGRITRLDLACTGYYPVEDGEAAQGDPALAERRERSTS